MVALALLPSLSSALIITGAAPRQLPRTSAPVMQMLYPDEAAWLTDTLMSRSVENQVQTFGEVRRIAPSCPVILKSLPHALTRHSAHMDR